MNYLLLGAVFLTIGAQASTVREVQTLSMPVTFAQVLIFGFASTAIGAAELCRSARRRDFPAIVADGDAGSRRRSDPAWWPHLVAHRSGRRSGSR